MNYQGQDVLQQTYDAVVVGSGATGGWAAKQLAEAGLKVALLEAGRAVSPKEFTEHMPAYKLKYRDHSPEIVRIARRRTSHLRGNGCGCWADGRWCGAARVIA